MDPYEHDRAMAESYADEYVRARAHTIPEAQHYAVNKAVREGYMKACAERDALKARNVTQEKCVDTLCPFGKAHYHGQQGPVFYSAQEIETYLSQDVTEDDSCPECGLAAWHSPKCTRRG